MVAGKRVVTLCGAAQAPVNNLSHMFMNTTLFTLWATHAHTHTHTHRHTHTDTHMHILIDTHPHPHVHTHAHSHTHRKYEQGLLGRSISVGEGGDREWGGACKCLNFIMYMYYTVKEFFLNFKKRPVKEFSGQ